jgi:hypothetical protein
MTALKNIPLVAAAALAATTLGLTVGLAPASAAPTQTPGTTLAVTADPANPGYYRLAVKGTFPMNEHDAHGFINNLEPGESPGASTTASATTPTRMIGFSATCTPTAALVALVQRAI